MDDFSTMVALALLGVAGSPIGWLSLATALYLGAARYPGWLPLLLAGIAALVLIPVFNLERAPPVTLLALLVASAIVCGAGWLVGRVARHVSQLPR